MELISVIIPTYNRATVLPRAIDSVLAQKGADFELIIVDDCTTDGTREILAGLEAEHRQVRVLLQDVNQGKGAALRRGFAEATGDIVLVQDAETEREFESAFEADWNAAYT